jgi:hypothetical protein
MARRLILHIGHHKTGSTSLQGALFEKRDLLLTHGFDYFTILANHSKPMRAMFEDKHFRETIGMSFEAVLQQKEVVWTAFRSQMDESNADFIISGEQLSMLPRWSIEQLHGALTPLFDEVVVIGYVRPPRSLVNSWAQQRLKRGCLLADMNSGGPPAPRYRFMFEKWLDLFGPESVTLRLFHRSHFKNGSLLYDFADAIGLPEQLVPVLGEQNRNSSLPMQTGKLISVINKRMNAQGISRAERETVSGRVARTQPDPGGPRYRLPAEVENRLLDMCRDDIQWVQKQLDVDFTDYDIEPPASDGEADGEAVLDVETLLDALIQLGKSCD